jgi:hypothetical protein
VSEPSAPATAVVPAAPVAASPLQNLLPHLLRTLRREPALAISLVYLLVAMAGIFYNERYYGAFGIPVLTLSQISDFLGAGIQQPMALLLVASTFPLCWVFDVFNARSRRRHVAERAAMRVDANPSAWQRLRLRFLDWRIEKQWYTLVGYLAVVICYGWMFVNLYADHRADAVRRGAAAEVRVWLSNDAAGLEATQGKAWTYLGAVANYVFVYDRAGERAVILPVNNIERIEPVVSRAGPATPMLVPIP